MNFSLQKEGKLLSKIQLQLLSVWVSTKKKPCCPSLNSLNEWIYLFTYKEVLLILVERSGKNSTGRNAEENKKNSK